MPPIREQIMSAVKAAIKQAAAGFPAAEDKEKERRAEICATCPSLNEKEYRCNECGCFLKWKIAMKTSTCPLNNWENKEGIKNDNTDE